MAKIVLISPPYIDLYGELRKATGRYFPLGLGYIAAYLRMYGGHEVFMFEPEAQGLSYEDLGNIIREKAPDVIGLTCSTPNFFRAIELARIARRNSRARIVLGGVHASALPEFIIEQYSDLIDCVVIGEGEVTMLELIDAYQKNEHPVSVKGVAFSKGNRVARTPFRPFIEDLDSIPFPSRDLIPQELFNPNLHNARYRNCFSVLTSRGCPFNCSFCASRIVSGRKYRVHSAEYVLAEMEMLKKDYNAKQLIITDDTFTMNRERLEKICRGMIDKKLNLSWFCFSQVSAVNRETLKMMKKAGCFSIGFGVESAEEAVLKRIGKPINPEKALEAVHLANSVGLKTQAFYVFGMPDETKQQMENTIRFSKRVNSTLAFFNMLVPYPGTREFEYYFSSIPLKDIDWNDFVAIGEKCVLQNAAVPAGEIEKLVGRANVEYYLNPGRLFRLLSHIRTFYEFSNYARGGMSLLKQISRWMKK
jgi:radical SAM superfamily enzyme YgiQ (UPF0313 family)